MTKKLFGFSIIGVIRKRVVKRMFQTQQELEIASISDASSICTTSAEEQYKKASKLRKKLISFALIAVISIEGLLAGGTYYIMQKNDLHRRVLREFEIRNLSQIKLRTGVYSGETNFGYFQGEGTFTFDSGEQYSGTWNNNQYQGLGELKIPSEGTYTGKFSGFAKSGSGTFKWDDGSVYTGGWKDDYIDGQGKYTSADGVVYFGTFEKGVFWKGSCSFENDTGKYELTYQDGKVNSASIVFSDGTTYTGGANRNAINGAGEMCFPNQDTYSGSYEGGKRSGKGVYKWANGDSYDGEWSADQISGTGTYTFSDGSVLSGTFANSSFVTGTYHVTNDFGEYLFNFENGNPNAVAIVLSDGTQYAGDITEGGLNGKAQIKYSNGDTYDGKVSNAMKSRQGKYTWTSGASYDGSWENDQMSGNGTYMYPSDEAGYKLTGTFANGVPEGECKYYTDSSTSYSTTWSGGKCTKVSE